jgi:hypothetical protein
MSWTLYAVTPRDQFVNHTLTLTQWLANENEDGLGLKRASAKLQAFMEASTLALPYVKAESGLRDEPRVGYDPVSDVPFFLFKASNNGTTFVVTPKQLSFRPSEMIDLQTLKVKGGPLEEPPPGSMLTPILRTCPRCSRVGQVYISPKNIADEPRMYFTIIWPPRNEGDPRGAHPSNAEELVSLEELFAPNFGCGYDTVTSEELARAASKSRSRSSPVKSS